MKKLYYIQPNTKIVELDGRDAILQSTSEIVTHYDDEPEYEGVGNGDGINNF